MPGDLLRISDLTETTPVRIDFADGAYCLSVRDVLRWIAPEAPEHEAMRFLMTCRMARIDPFRQEAFLIPYDTKHGRKWSIVIGKAGYLRMAEENPNYDGHQSGIVIHHPDTGLEKEIEGSRIPDEWNVIGGWARVFRRDRKFPTYCSVGSEFYRETIPMWQTQTPTMYRKTALIHALEEAGLCFGYSGTYDRAEMPASDYLPPDDAPIQVSAKVAAEYEATPLPSLGSNMVGEIQALLDELGATPFEIRKMLARRGVSTIAELSEGDAQALLLILRTKVDEQNAGEVLLPDPGRNEASQREGVASAEETPAVDPGLAEGEWVDDGGEVHDKTEDKDPNEVDDDGPPDDPDADVDDGTHPVPPDDVVKDFGITSPEDDSDFPDAVRPPGGPAKPRRRKPAKA
jgi:phage recombination protein Bet